MIIYPVISALLSYFVLQQMAGWEYRVFVRAPSGPSPPTEASERSWASTICSRPPPILLEGVAQQVLGCNDEARTDFYIRAKDTKSTGIKLRGGANLLEVKIRKEKDGPFEYWEKFGKEVNPGDSSNLEGVAALAREAGFEIRGSGDVVEVKKYRMQVVTTVGKAEATTLLIHGERWRTVCVEGPSKDIVKESAAVVTEMVGDGFAMGYPEWIEMIRKEREPKAH